MRDVPGHESPESVREVEPKHTFPLPEVFLGRMEELELHGHREAYMKVLEIARAIKEAGGLALLIGGSVRDVFFGKISKDFDLEVYGLPANEVEKTVRKHAKVNEVGAAFGVLKLSFGTGIEADISLPRTDSKVAEGHRGFDVKTDPNMSIKEAARRRDFTMNTLSADPLTGQINDPFGGIQDILEHRLRVTDRERFVDDPLRVLRGVQFVSRFGLEVDQESMKIMQDVVPRLKKETTKERVLEEWKKLLLKSEKPSIGIALSLALGSLRELHPELVDGLIKQETGALSERVDRWMQMLISVDEMARIIRRESLPDHEAFVFMLTAVASNLVPGNRQGGRESVKQKPPNLQAVDAFLDSMKADNETRKQALAMISSRQVPVDLYVAETYREESVSDGDIRRLAKQIHPATIRSLVLLAEADHVGRGALGANPTHDDLLLPQDGFPARDWLLARAQALGIAESKPTHVIEGGDWLRFGFKPGRDIGRLIALSNDLRDEKCMTPERIFQRVEGITDSARAVAMLETLLET
jgi:tRNA nucleotidyltransferase (CCA-adding enzyme)